jgi:hypothetical protein
MGLFFGRPETSRILARYSPDARPAILTSPARASPRPVVDNFRRAFIFAHVLRGRTWVMRASARSSSKEGAAQEKGGARKSLQRLSGLSSA